MTPGGRKRSEKGRGAPVAGVAVGGTNIEVGLVDVDHRVLGLGIGSTLNVVDVICLVVGGGMAEKLGQGLADQIGAATTPSLLTPHPELRFVAAALGDDSGVVGAAALARAQQRARRNR